MGVNETVLAVNYLSDVLKKSIGKSYAGIKIRYSREKTALGTGGPIKRGKRFLGEEDKFMVMNGDVIFDEGMGKIVDVYEKNEGIATLALREVEDTSRFGVALLGKDGRISGFIEKPKPGEVAGRWVNAGFYVFSKKIFEYIPSGRKVSIEREVFPILAQEGNLYSFKFSGYWCDIGKVDDFINANRRFLDLLPKKGVEVGKGVTLKQDVQLKPPVKICQGATIGKRAIVGPYTVIGKGSIVGDESHISQSILFNECTISDKVEMDGSILGDGVSIGVGARLLKQVIVGEGVKVADGVNIVGTVSICPYKEIMEDIVESGIIA
jgi:NDP-sugar pyrophosphorylase family protein